MLDVPNNLHWVTIQLITHQKVDDILAHVLSVHWCRESEGGSTCNCTSVLVPETWLLRWGAGGGWGFVLRLGASWVSRTNGLIYSISCSILCRLTPLPSRSLSKATQDGSTPSDYQPRTPCGQCAWRNRIWGLEIMDLSILPLLSVLFFFLGHLSQL